MSKIAQQAFWMKFSDFINALRFSDFNCLGFDCLSLLFRSDIWVCVVDSVYMQSVGGKESPTCIFIQKV